MTSPVRLPEERYRRLGSETTKGTVGRVTIVGAGPGSSDYLTLGGLRALQAADVVLFDALVQQEVLDLARHQARRIDVGKRCGRGSCQQEDINRLAIQLALQGLHVVRLKSGDPSIFGRAGEEIAECKAAGVPVEVVPGITAAVAMAARLGASLTDRRWAHSVRLITGHATTGALPEGLDWAGIADPETTLVFYMAGRTASGVRDRLLAHGLGNTTPVAVAADISGPGEAFARGRLGELAAIVGSFELEKPILIGVGQVFASGPEETAVLASDRAQRLAHAQLEGRR